MVAARTAMGHPATSRRRWRPRPNGHGSSRARGTTATVATAAATTTPWSRRQWRPRPPSCPPAWSHARLHACLRGHLHAHVMMVHGNSCDGDAIAWEQWRRDGMAATATATVTQWHGSSSDDSGSSSGDNNGGGGGDSNKNGGSGSRLVVTL
jgi:hypothetical protein